MLKLPLSLRPKKETEFVRLGKANDGGYVVPANAVKESDLLLSFGLDDDWSFEKDFYKTGNKNIIICDGSVNFNFWVKKIIKDIIQIFRFEVSVKKIFIDLLQAFKYYIFFNKKKINHLKKFLASENFEILSLKKKNQITLRDLVEKKNYNSILLKIDIEGNEYRILDELIKYQNLFSSLVIEFHNCDLFLKKIENFISEFKLELVHIHVNNFGDLRKDFFPTVIEMTFSKDAYNRNRNNFQFPNLKIDQPNNPKEKDLKINFF